MKKDIKYICALKDALLLKQVKRLNKNFKNLTIKDIVEKQNEYENSIIILQDIPSYEVKNLREKNSVFRIIYINTKENQKIDDKLLLSQLSAYISTPIDIVNLQKAFFQAQKELEQFSKYTLYKFSNHFYWENMHKILFDDKAFEVKLTATEKKIFEILLKNHNTLVLESTILEYLYFDDITISSKSFKNVISSLRKKIPGISIENLYSEGYKLNTPKNSSTIDLIKLDHIISLIDINKDTHKIYDGISSALLQSYNSTKVFITKQKKQTNSIEILCEKVAQNIQKSNSKQIDIKNHYLEKSNNFQGYISDPITYDEKELIDIYFQNKNDLFKKAQIKSILLYRFKVNDALYSLEIHQHNYNRVWTQEEKIFLKYIVYELQSISSKMNIE